ncbi:MAG: hypothetical protein IPH86_17480 [bacterium]|nr:hypothetical protein [bacterium]
MPGLLVSIRVRTGARTDVVRVPAAALVDGNALFVVGADDVARKRPVTIGASDPDFVEIITSGLDAGEQVVRFRAEPAERRRPRPPRGGLRCPC